jgi:2-O-methyltransferase
MEILERFKQIVSQNQLNIVIEIGAADGYHSRIMLDILQNTGKRYIYHLFEPNTDLLQSVVGRISYYLTSNGNDVKFYNEAIGSVNAVGDFYKSGNNYNGSSSIRKPKNVLDGWKDMTFTKTTVNIITLDKHIERVNLKEPIIDFIWADVQGAEIDLIKGAEETFKKVRYLYTEYVNAEWYEGQIGLSEILSMLPDFEIVEDYGGDVLLKNKNL